MNDMRPPPPIDPETDIRDLDGFMLNVERLLASELWALSTGEEFKAALALWCRAWKQKPAGSLPNDERVLAAFSGAGKRWRRVRDMALRGFVEHSDGRLYHLVLVEDVKRAALKKEERRERTRAATEARKRQRDEQRNDERDVDRSDQRDVDRDVEQTGNVTRSQGQGQGQGQRKKEHPASSTSSLDAASAPPAEPPPDAADEGSIDGPGDEPARIPTLDEPDDDPPEIDPARLIVQALDGAIVAHYGQRQARPYPHQTDMTTARRWLEQGGTVTACRDVIDAVVARRKAKGQDRPESLKFFERSMADALKAPKANGATNATALAPAAKVDAWWTELSSHADRVWAEMVDEWERGGRKDWLWDHRCRMRGDCPDQSSKAPGQPRCTVPLWIIERVCGAELAEQARTADERADAESARRTCASICKRVAEGMSWADQLAEIERKMPAVAKSMRDEFGDHEPGHPDCRIPADVVAEVLGEGVARGQGNYSCSQQERSFQNGGK